MSDENTEQLSNSYQQLALNLTGAGIPFNGPQISQSDTLFFNNRWYLISNFRQLLSELYVEHGIIQTLVDQPVDDAFRSGFEIKSAQLDGNDIEKIMTFLEKNRIIEKVKQACKWARLYGGGAIIPITTQRPSTPLRVQAITADTPLDFKAVDLWELYYTYMNVYSDADLMAGGERMDDSIEDHYDYYGVNIHKSRVFRIMGKEAPSFIRPRLRGWGMSECERIVRSFNQYLKNQDVVFELLDEAKVDVYKIKGLNTSLLNANGTNAVTNRVQVGNMIKNYLNALTMDKEDEYEQKQMAFTGLGEMLVQIRQGIAADLKMPITKLFGISAAGFSSGEDDIENYNSMIESEIRSRVKYILLDVLQLVCQKLFGVMPDDLMVHFNPLRILSAVEEEEVKDFKFNRLMTSYQSGAIDHPTWAQGINKDNLLPIEIDENSQALPPLENQFQVEPGKKDKAGAKKKSKE